MSLGWRPKDDFHAMLTELTRRASAAPPGLLRTGDLPPTPTFLPYLLQGGARTPRELFNDALALRKQGSVKDYRAWQKKALNAIGSGWAPKKQLTELAQISAAVARDLGLAADNTVTVKASVSVIGPELGVEKTLNPAAAMGWILPNVPSYRYRKLLTDLVVAQGRLWHADIALGKIWDAA